MNVACSTCLDSFTLESDISTTPCGHVFHTDCITKWIESGQKNCSQCRTGCEKKTIVKLFFSQNELGLHQNEVFDDMTEENQKLLKQANEAKSRELEASKKVEKIQSENIGLKKIIKTYRNVELLNVKRNFDINKQDMQQIEELKKEVNDLKSKLHKSAGISTVQQQQSQPLRLQPQEPSQPQEPQQAQEPQERAQDVGKSKLMAQQLGLLLHAQNCLKEEKERKLRHEVVGTLGYRNSLDYNGGCYKPHCKTMKTVLIHMSSCLLDRKCQLTHCSSSRQILDHWSKCPRKICPVCQPIKMAIQGQEGSRIPDYLNLSAHPQPINEIENFQAGHAHDQQSQTTSGLRATLRELMPRQATPQTGHAQTSNAQAGNAQASHTHTGNAQTPAIPSTSFNLSGQAQASNAQAGHTQTGNAQTGHTQAENDEVPATSFNDRWKNGVWIPPSEEASGTDQPYISPYQMRKNRKGLTYTPSSKKPKHS